RAAPGLAGGGGEPVGRARGEDDSVSGRDGEARGRGADPGRCARDEEDLALVVRHEVLSKLGCGTCCTTRLASSFRAGPAGTGSARSPPKPPSPPGAPPGGAGAP